MQATTLETYDSDKWRADWSLVDLSWSPDYIHLLWLFNVLMAGGFNRTLEIGVYEGRSMILFLEALSRGRIGEAHFCDVLFRPEPKRMSDAAGKSAVLHECKSVDLLRQDDSFDFVWLDGDHSPATVLIESAMLLAAKTRCVMAHDTATVHVGELPAEADGPQYIKRAFMGADGYYCLEDAIARSGRVTHRGMFFATNDPDLYTIAQKLYRRIM
jgi:hypothetical protein